MSGQGGLLFKKYLLRAVFCWSGESYLVTNRICFVILVPWPSILMRLIEIQIRNHLKLTKIAWSFTYADLNQ